ncbi:RPII140upstream gene proteinlike, partial [Caligus rogercresseyi]
DISESTTVAYITGFAIGGFKTSRDAYQRFVLEHKHEIKLRERIFLGLFKGGIKYGLHIAVLTFTFTFACSIFLVYRNYRNPLDNALCGSILGAMYTLLRGPKAAISGGVIGGLLGLFAIAGESSQDRWRRLYHIMQEEEEKETAMAKKIQMNASWAESDPEEESDWDRN